MKYTLILVKLKVFGLKYKFYHLSFSSTVKTRDEMVLKLCFGVILKEFHPKNIDQPSPMSYTRNSFYLYHSLKIEKLWKEREECFLCLWLLNHITYLRETNITIWETQTIWDTEEENEIQRRKIRNINAKIFLVNGITFLAATCATPPTFPPWFFLVSFFNKLQKRRN